MIVVACLVGGCGGDGAANVDVAEAAETSTTAATSSTTTTVAPSTSTTSSSTSTTAAPTTTTSTTTSTTTTTVPPVEISEEVQASIGLTDDDLPAEFKTLIESGPMPDTTGPEYFSQGEFRWTTNIFWTYRSTYALRALMFAELPVVDGPEPFLWLKTGSRVYDDVEERKCSTRIG